MKPLRTSTNGETFKIKCPCGAEIGWSKDASGTPDGVIHALPQCEPFRKLGPIEYLRYVRGVA